MTPEQGAHAIKEGDELKKLLDSTNNKTSKEMLRESYVPGVNNISWSEKVLQVSSEFKQESERDWFEKGIDPFAHFKFCVDPRSLHEMPREKCPSCSKPFQLYCSKCLQVTVAPSVKIPSFTLPLSVDYIFHRQESIRKSTGIHACVLAPRQCRIVAFPSQVPDYDPDSTVLLFPSPAAVYLDDPSLDFSTIKKVILIESTWQKANTVAAHPNFANLRHVRIRDRVSTFWRYQELGSQFLSTLEATFYLCVEAFEQMKKQQACAAELQPPKRDDGNAAEVRYEQKQNREQEQTQPQPESKNHYNHEFDNLMLFYAYSHYRVFQNYVSVAKGDHRAEAEEGKCGEQEDRNAGQKRLRFPKVWQTTDLTSSAPRK